MSNQQAAGSWQRTEEMSEVRGLRLEAKRKSRRLYTASSLKRGQQGRALLQPHAKRALSELWPRSGFTLLEILIAIAILALVVSSLYGAYSGTMETTEMVESVRAVDQAARLALMQMVDDFSSLYYKKAEKENEDSPFRFQGGMDGESEGGTVVEFASTAHLGFDGSFPNLRVNRVSYVLEKQEDSQRYYRLVRMELPFADLSAEREETAVELADNVESLTVTFLNEDGETLSQWDSKAQETKGVLPRLVHIRLQLAGEKSRVFATTVALQVWGEEKGEGQ